MSAVVDRIVDDGDQDFDILPRQNQVRGTLFQFLMADPLVDQGEQRLSVFSLVGHQIDRRVDDVTAMQLR
ncbi:hypothetical protein [Nocardia sp. NPDC049707]|uniref:hypothetical protein n=1 Tax=Nocardia sp. NPDC049707 TaxID=3154735 RepID=UPI00341941CE